MGGTERRGARAPDACGLRRGRFRTGLGTQRLAAVLMCAAAGCTSIVQRAGITWLYREAKHPDVTLVPDSGELVVARVRVLRRMR